MAPSRILIDNDNIIPAHGSYDNLSPRDARVREAMFLITLIGPIVAAVFTLFATKGWYKPTRVYSFGVLSTAWFVTVSAFGTLVFFQKGHTSRLTFMLAVLHGQVEVLIWLLLLNLNITRSLLISWLWGMALYIFVLAAPDTATVFIVASIIAGANDFMIGALLVYGRKWWLALGAVGHLLSAVVVFTNFVVFVPVVTFNALTFISLWFHLGPTVGGVVLLRNSEGDSPSNPLTDHKVSLKAVLILLTVSLIASSGITFLLAYVAPA